MGIDIIKVVITDFFDDSLTSDGVDTTDEEVELWDFIRLGSHFEVISKKVIFVFILKRLQFFFLFNLFCYVVFIMI